MNISPVLTLLLLLCLSSFSHAQWTPQNSNTIYPLLGIAFHDSLHGISVGGSTNGGIGVITVTTNGGTNWNPQFFPERLRSVSMVDSMVAYACGDAGYMLKTTDGGQNWATQTTGTNFALHSVHFLNRDTGYTSGNVGTLLRTRDGGNTWQALNSGTNLILYEVQFPSDTVGYAVGNSGEIRKTTDAGDTWTQSASGTILVQRAICFLSEFHGYTVGNSGEIRKTTNGAISWNLLNSGTILTMYDVLFPLDSVGYAVGNVGMILTTTDAGASWTAENSGTNLILYGIDFAQGQGYVSGNSGYIAKRTGDTIVTVGLENRLQQQFSLSPNPTSEEVWVDWGEFGALDCQAEEIAILNSSGQLVFRQAIDPTAPRRILISLRGFAPGIYCVALRSGQGTTIRKLLVL